MTTNFAEILSSLSDTKKTKHLQALVASRARFRFDENIHQFVGSFAPSSAPNILSQSGDIQGALLELVRLTESTLTDSQLEVEITALSNSSAVVEPTSPNEKPRKETAGVSGPIALWQEVNRRAQADFQPTSQRARILIMLGFEDFRQRMLYENPNDLLDEFGKEGEEWKAESNRQLMVRFEPKQLTRLKISAKEYGRSVSELCRLCMIHGLELEKHPRT